MADLVLNWGLFGAFGTVMGSSQTVDAGGVDVTVDFNAEDPGASAFTYNADGYVGSGEPFDGNSFLKLADDGNAGGATGPVDTSTTTISFAASDDQYGNEVQNVSFRINDIDVGRNDPGDESPNHIDYVTVRAYDADGNEVPVTFTPGSDVVSSGSGMLEGGNEAWLPTDGQASSLVSIDEPVARIEIEYDNGEDGAQRVTVSDIHFTTTDAEAVDPDAVDDSATTDYETPIMIDVLANDTDPQGQVLAIASVSDGSNGTVSIDPVTGQPVYTPEIGFSGTDTFTYTVEDPDGNTDIGTVTVTVGSGSGLDYIVEGTDGDDLIDTAYTGDPEGDMIDNNDNMPGNPPQQDTVMAGDGDDVVEAGEGDDSVFGGTGDDTLYGEEGDDTLIGEEGEDSLIGGTGDDSMRGGDDDDTLIGGEGNDTAFGDDGDDVIDLSNGIDPAIDVVTFPGIPVDADPNDDRDEANGGDGNDSITTGDDADTIYGDAGNDTIDAGIDNDEIYGGDGDDLITDPQGADYVEGGAGNDTILVGIDTFSDYVGDDPNLPIPDGSGGQILSDPNTTDGMDTVFGGDGNDSVETGDDADYIDGGTGNDTINAGIDDDTVIGGEGDDSIIGGHGSDSITGNDGDDWINAGDSTLLWGQEPDATDPVPTNGMDTVFGGAGNDTIYGQDDDDSIDGGTGDDVIDGGIDDDVLRGREGNDTIYGQQGADTVTGGLGEDVIYGDDTDGTLDLLDATDPDPDDNRDYLDGRQDDDTIYGGDDDDTLLGGNGDDYLDGGIDEDSITGGAGDDTLVGGQGADTMFGESGRDDFIGSDVGDYIDGGSSPDGINPADGLPYDYDTLDLSGSAPVGGSLTVEYTSADREDGIVHFFDDTGAEIGTSEFYDIENVVPCFTPGTAIATPKGERMVEELKVGDKIITRDNGIQEIRWMGTRTLTGHELARAPQLRPILIQKGSLGDNLPEHDMLVSPQHRMLLTGNKTQLYFEEREVLAAAKHLTDMPGVDEVGTLGVTYVHFMFDQHEVVLSNGAWTESFQPGANVLNGLGNEQRDEIFQLFPELETVDGVENYTAARRALKKHEARLLAK
ncbi:Hint domain-containing protein [Rhodalgimonas zhirmunskyi]|uniref:Hint domain-containing protein n=1 Tax=Rhodalgimonas zhirmunskyi TaxID=2964767 RepID=A0AAJ1U7X0_9RHOB|nr:Hint domain-containing protein [Rhodoalgimonas zhirmunskyi]MDQ2092728.1 Hint domain-containing protein [Rhodoalgimonas zhirmunskyi]